MIHYIDKSALVAEIERTQKRLNIDDIGGRSVMAWSEGFKNFINTLEVKEVQEEHCTETEFREIEILRTKLSDIAKAIYYHEGKENPTIERIREIVQDCCFELMDLKKPKQEEPVNEEWIEELRTKLDSMSKEDFKKVFNKYAIDFDEEPVSEELGDYINELSKQFPEVSFAKLSRIAVRVAKWQKEQINEVLLSEVLPCFMHGGEADEVVAKLEEMLNKKK